jgi:hypothetical protein
VLLGTPTVENSKLGIRGRPDGVDVADGSLIPIEITGDEGVGELHRRHLPHRESDPMPGHAASNGVRDQAAVTA